MNMYSNSDLLYLMVLIDSHTISKSIDNNEKLDDIFDSITDLDYTRNPKLRRDTFLHKYKTEFKEEYVKPAEAIKDSKLFPDTEKTTEKTTRKTSTEHSKHHKSPKRRVGSFWRKFRGKYKKPKHNDGEERKRKISKNRAFSTKYLSTKDFRNTGPRIETNRKYRNAFILRHPESYFGKSDRNQNLFYHNKEHHLYHNGNKLQIGIAPHIDTMKLNQSIVNTKMEQVTTENLGRVLATITTRLAHLKELYGLEGHHKSPYSVTPSFDKLTKSKLMTATPKPKEKPGEIDFPGTEQIEKLLNDIKAKAVHIIEEHNPYLAELITNTVTEATFEMDPILTHIDLIQPANIENDASINDDGNFNEQTRVDLNDSELVTNTESHYLQARSVKEETMTMAHNVEDLLQRELKNIYHLVKNKVSNDFLKEVHKIKTTIKNCKDCLGKSTTKTPITKATKATTKSKMTPSKNVKVMEITTSTIAPRHGRGESRGTVGDKLDTVGSTNPTYDDYMMLTLYEQMLVKTHENNVRNMLSTAELPLRMKRENFRLSKRNPETLTDVKLREYVQKLYEEEMIPEYDYVETSMQTDDNNTPEPVEDNAQNNPPETFNGSTAMNKPSLASKAAPDKASQKLPQSSEDSTVDSSFQGLSEKISYNDYVNGYRHYLKFQKEQNNQNFSNLIKYQAHKHHSVEDIGKFILNKIPSVPSNRLKRSIFDDTDMDYQEISTKNDDSWFRKHFYLFIDNGPPKKFHTSQTVALKSIITEPDMKYNKDPDPAPAPTDQVFIRIGSDDSGTTKPTSTTAGMNLDDLSEILDSLKEHQKSSSMIDGSKKQPNNLNNETDSVVNTKEIPHGFIGKLFGNRRRQAVKKVQTTTEYNPFLYMFTEPLQRVERTATREDADNTAIDDFIKKVLEVKSSTKGIADVSVRSVNKEPSKYGYVDIDLIRRHTALVKLKENTPKQSRIKDFFKKFHFKKDKGKKHPKRSCRTNDLTRRRARFNPIKKLKDMFRVKIDSRRPSETGVYHEPDQANLPNVPNTVDYDIMNSHLETFKSIKYDRPLSIEEMRKEIPNITDVLGLESYTTTRKSTPAFVFKLDEKDRNLLYNYKLNSTLSKTMAPAPSILLSKSTPNTAASHTKSMTRKTKLTKIKKLKTPPNNLITVNVKTLKATRPTMTSGFTKTIQTDPPITLENMNVILSTIQYKLRKTTKHYTNYLPQNSKRETKVHHSNKTGRRKQCKKLPDDLTINSKLTRIAKFPLSNHSDKRNDEGPRNLGTDYLNFQDGSFFGVYKHSVGNKNAGHDQKTMFKSGVKKIPNDYSPSQSYLDEKFRYTDYFNDLLMWNNDILNLDKVPSPIWKSILKNIQPETGEMYTTPNMNHIMSELNEMNDFLVKDDNMHKIQKTAKKHFSNSTSDEKDDVTYIKTGPNLDANGVIRSIAMNDNAIVTSQTYLIKGEAKYFQFNRPNIVDTPLGSSNFLSKLYQRHDVNNGGNVTGKGYPSYSPDVDNEVPAILVDTTIMAYDNDVESVTKDLDSKKLSKHSKKSNKTTNRRNHMLQSPFLKSNKAPMQYYTTPVPMKSYEFEKFLIDHKLDVESVTCPILDLPTISETWTSRNPKPPFLSKIDQKKVAENSKVDTKKTSPLTKKINGSTVTTTIGKSIKSKGVELTHNYPFIIMHRKITPKRNFPLYDLDRYRRYTEKKKLSPKKAPFKSVTTVKPSKTTQELNYYNKFKKKMRLFEKKETADVPVSPTTEAFSLDPRNKEVEITIINFDDFNKQTTPVKFFESFTLSPIKKEDTPPQYPYFPDHLDETTESSSRTGYTQKEKQTLHNELLYKDVFKEPTTISTTEAFTAVEISKGAEYAIPLSNEPTTLSVTKLHHPFEFLSKMPHNMKNFNTPKRVHISSHHYKYDIFYNDDRKAARRFEGFHPKLSLNTVTPSNRIQQIKLTDIRPATNAVNKEWDKKIYKIGRRSRPRRDITVTDGTRSSKPFTRHGCKPKPEGGLSVASNEEFETVLRPTSVKDTHPDSSHQKNLGSDRRSETTVEAQPGSLVYDLKHLRSTTSDTLMGRHRRLFQIPAIIQNNIKILLKNVTDSVQIKSSKSSVPSTVTESQVCQLKCNGTHTGDAKTYVVKEGLTNEAEGFQIHCGAGSEREATEMMIASNALSRTTTKSKCKMLQVVEDSSKEFLYVEPSSYNDQIYYEGGAVRKAESRLPTPTRDANGTDLAQEHLDKKRDIKVDQQNTTFTARDVAALEVIVDLMKNTLSYEEKDVASVFNNLLQLHTTRPLLHNESTNSIQVHIAIPFDFQNGKKRSPFDPVRVRKVFSARMSTPVDLEYQVNSFEGIDGPSTSCFHSNGSPEDGLSPGMYLLVDKPKNEYALKPVKAKFNLSNLKTRQAGFTETMTEAKSTETREMETTSLKNLAKVTLSKEFISVVNKHLIDLYENMTKIDKDAKNPRMIRSVWKSRRIKEVQNEKKKNKCTEQCTTKRRIDWEAVKKYFGHDRVCNCNCKPNKTMCRACAASDAVVDELIFEFDNLGRYMKDHCTELQTFFWMNPSGGLKLRDSVSRIDKSLNDYYKRVKGKCQGRTCQTFATSIDKRQIVKTFKVPKQALVSHLFNDIVDIAEDLNKTVSLTTCFNNQLKLEGDKFIGTFNRCISKKIFNKRSNMNTTKRKFVKNVYSLDNINVNIICKPEIPTTMDAFEQTATTIPHPDLITRVGDHLFDYDDISDKNKPKKRKGLKKLFPRKSKNKLFTYFVATFTKQPKLHFKRQANNLMATSLISDGGGAFWYDYIKGSTNEPRIARESGKEKPTFEIAVVQRGKDEIIKANTFKHNQSKAPSTIYMTVRTTPNRILQRDDIEMTTDYLTHNINQLLWLFGSLQDIESMNMNSNRSTMFLTHSEKPTDYKKLKTKKPKYVKKVNSNSTTTKTIKNPALNNTVIENMMTNSFDTKLSELQIKNPLESLETTTTDSSSTTMCLHKLTFNPPTTTIVPTDTAVNEKQIESTISKSITKATLEKIKSPTTTVTTTNIQVNAIKTMTPTPATEREASDPRTRFNGPELPPLKRLGATRSGFLSKVKTATFCFLQNMGKDYIDDRPETYSPRTSTGYTKSIIDRISETEINIPTIESSQMTTYMNPTIVIINDDGDNEINSDILNDSKNFDGYRNLLLSIIQYESNRLNDEWHKIAYGNERDEGDVKRSISTSEKSGNAKVTTTSKTGKPESVAGCDSLKGLKTISRDLQLPDPDAKSGHDGKSKKPEGLLNKIVSKIGMKVISASKKKKAKKPTVQEVTEKLNSRNKKTKDWHPTTLNQEEACDTRRTSKSKTSRICDIKATYGHILDLQKTLPSGEFENLVRNISCYKYKNVVSNFYIPYKRKGKRWDWIRNKRSIKLHFSRVKDDKDLGDGMDVVNFVNDYDFFETFVRGADGIYTIVNRRKRTAYLKALDVGLRNIPPLMPGENEVYVKVGDTITLDCLPQTMANSLDYQFHWRTDRKNMLKQDNVDVKGIRITIHNVEPRNIGSYTCVQNNAIKRHVRVSVMTVPGFDVVFLPIYKTEGRCTYDDLRAIQRLSGLMAEEIGCGNACSVRIDEPVCQRDRGTNSSLIRSTAVISMTPCNVNCSLQCRRDIVSSLVMLCASNTPALSSVGVVVSKDNANETLRPWKDFMRPVVTHALRKKDSNGHREYHKLVSTLSPGKVDVVLICPAGYYLITEQKICTSCPPNTCSSLGDNTCTSCPRGTHSAPGANKCDLLSIQPRRYDWWWYPPCGYVVAILGLVVFCCLCACLAMIVHMLSRDSGDPPDPDPRFCYEEQSKQSKKDCNIVAAYAHTPRTRPLSPSRVILARFFKPSLTSSRATDSQETKFELWKERNIPPPLPPIDFDI